MCIPKVPKPPAPPPMPQQSNADANADKAREKLAARKGYAAMIKTGPGGVSGYGKSGQVAGLEGGMGTKLGANQ
jgi:hypothetical protein